MSRVLARSCQFPDSLLIQRRGTHYRIKTTVPNQRQLLTDGICEAAETAYLERFLRPGMVVVDIGANIGYYTLLCSRCVGPGGHVYAFEPTPANIEQLTENLRLNPFATNVTVRACAAGEAARRLQLIESAGDSGQNYMSLAEGGTEVIAIDSLQLPRLDFLKMDTEGFEPYVLRGAAATIARCRPVLLVEVNPPFLARYGHTASDLAKLLAQMGYRLQHPTWRGLEPYREPTRKEIFLNVLAFPI
ncbi:MAG: FkbM family methyltransferase [Terriglobales bacterium]